MDIGKTFLKAINNNYWCRIEYNNGNEITKFMIGINDIDPSSKAILCDEFNLMYSSNVQRKYKLFFDKIKSAEICENTYHKTPDKLINFINEKPEFFLFMKTDVSKDELIDYYIDCFKMDTTPYVGKYGLIKGIDDDELLKEDTYALDEDQFKTLVKESYFKKENKKKKRELGVEKLEQYLCVNVLSIKTHMGLYVLAYRPLKLDLEIKSLVPDKEIIINKEFILDPDSNDVRKKESIYRYIPEDKYYLINDFENHKDEIIAIIREHNDTKNSSYKNEVKIDTRPFIICLETRLTVDIEYELNKVKELMANKDVIPLPLRTFLGDPESKLARRTNYPIFTVDKLYNIDQINAINIGMKSPASYIQGPPGTGKTQTLLNAILTAVFNDKAVLITSNNNVPMDGIYENILKLKYKDRDELLFPAIRLGSVSNVEKAVLKIREMYERSIELTVKDNRIKEIKEERKEAMKSLVELLDKHDKKTILTERLESLNLMKSKYTNDFMEIKINAEIEALKKELLELGNVDDNFESYMNIDHKKLFMALHFETAGKLQKLKNNKYKEIYEIIYDATLDNKNEKAMALREFLSDGNNLKLFMEIFPVIISTNLSCTYLGDVGKNFDIVMMDEAGQCNIANALIPISRAQQIMLVGDPQQLKPVIVLDPNVNKKLRNKYHIPEDYDYIENSIYTTYTKVDAINNEALLRSHYRCNNKIIGFSNKKYYNNKLLCLSKSTEPKPLVFVDTYKDDKGINNLKNVSESEAKYIVNYISENPDQKIGIITPFVSQKECIETYLEDNGINNVSVGTVHAFQGNQQDVILFSTAITNKTADKTYNWLKNNKELINVAVSRAKDKLVMLGNMKAIDSLSEGQDDIRELALYVANEGAYEVTNVSPESIALGTRHISTESEKDLAETVNHVLSVINQNCYIKVEQAIASLFTDEGNTSSIFYNGRFDMVVFEHTYSGDVIKLAIEENGPEHFTDEEVIRRDKLKDEFCKRHNLKILKIRRDCARDYNMIKNALLEIIKVKK